MNQTPRPGRLLDQVVSAVRQIRPEITAVGSGDTFAALGMDSLDRLALAVAVEQTIGRTVSDLVLSDAAGPADLARRLSATRDEEILMEETSTSPASTEPGWIDEGGRAGHGTQLWHQAQIAPGASVGSDCTLGKGCFVGTGSTVGDDVKIGNYAGIFGAVIGDRAMICPGVQLLEDPNPRATTPDSRRKVPDDWTHRPVVVGSGATIGAGAVVAPGVGVGDHALVGAGAVVLRDVPAHGLVLGNPARQVGWVCRCAQSLNADLICPGCGRTHQHDNDGLAEENKKEKEKSAPLTE